MRGACNGITAELDPWRYEEGRNVRRRGYDDGRGGYGLRYCVEGPTARLRRYADGFNGGFGFEV